MICAYVFDRKNLTLNERDAAYLNQMNYSFALIENGMLTGKHWKKIDVFQAYMQQHPHILPVLAVGGWGADGFSQAAATQQGRKQFAQSAMALMDKYGFLGLDIDWEYPCSSAAGIQSDLSDKENLTLLLDELRHSLNACQSQDGQRRYLSIAVGGTKAHTDALDLASISTIVDQVNIMTYDMRGSEKTTGHHTNLFPQANDHEQISAISAINAYHSGGIDKSKIMLGAAFYGHAWQEVPQGNSALMQLAGTNGAQTHSYQEIVNLIASGAYQQHWDDIAKAHYLLGNSNFISYESPESIAAKGHYAVEHKLMGVMFWEYSQDTSGVLLKALYDAMH